MNENEKKALFENKSNSKSYLKIKRIGQGSYSTVFLVEEKISQEK